MAHETVPGLVHAVANMEGGPYYTRGQAANALGVTYDTMRRWMRPDSDAPRPSLKVKHGQQEIYVYTDDDLAALSEWRKTIHYGRPKKEKK